MANDTFVGHVDGVLPGDVFEDREAVKAANLHSDNQAGISTSKDTDGCWVANAIALNGGYEDDEDHGDWIRYTGAGGRDQSTKKQISDQDWDHRTNAALRRSYDRGYPIRIIRGSKAKTEHAPKKGYRYDGLYAITDLRMISGKSDWRICQFDLHRLTDVREELTEVERKVEAALLDFTAEEKFPETRMTTVQRIVRDSSVVRRVKEMYGHECQVCRTRLVGGDGKGYSEGAHIRPLGKQHRGPDVVQNVLCLCANCHVRLDKGALYIADDWRVIDRAVAAAQPQTVFPELHRSPKHNIGTDYIQYHREWWDEQLSTF
ncbi:YDG/SRA domain-containing protein [Streptomyces sp. NPDC050315]|uniref:YDG/SRA domain-containing protein n=1 Tax=Streptomyces sp. NPDC050315 TaxID=3155039 RepID=UPI003417342E